MQPFRTQKGTAIFKLKELATLHKPPRMNSGVGIKGTFKKSLY